MGRDRDAEGRVRRPLRLAGLAAVVLLVSWAPPATDGPLVPIDDEPLRPVGPAVGSVPAEWSAASLTEEATCYYLTVSPAPGGGFIAVPKHENPSEPSCHHSVDDDDPEPAW